MEHGTSTQNGDNSTSLLEAGLKGLPISETSPLLTPTEVDAVSIDVSVQSIQPLPGMQLRAHVMEPGINRVRPVPVKEATKRKTKNAQYWIDIDADQNKDRAEMIAWLQQLKFLPTFILSRLAEPSTTWASQVVALDTAILAVIRILPMEESSEDTAYMAAVVVNQLLLTFTSGPRRDICGLYDRALHYMNARENPTDSTDALFGWVYFHVERTSKSLRLLRYHVLKMDAAMDRDISSVQIREVIEAKDHLLNLFGVAEEQHECLEALQASTSSSISFSPGTLSVLVAQSGAAERMAVRLEKQIGDLRLRHESHQQERMNRRLAMLTVLSAVFLPLTLVTGIWGMNFQYSKSTLLRSYYLRLTFYSIDCSAGTVESFCISYCFVVYVYVSRVDGVLFLESWLVPLDK